MFNGTKQDFIIEAIEIKLNDSGILSQDDYQNILVEAEEEFV